MKLEFVTPSPVKIPEHLSDHVWDNLERFNDVEIAILGISEYRGDEANKGCEHGPDAIRKAFYELKNFPKVNIADVGNILMGDSYTDSIYALKTTMHRLLEHRIIPILLGGDITMMTAHEQAYHGLYFPFINIMHVDETFRLHSNGEDVTDVTTYLDQMISRKPTLIFNYIQLGYQTYMTDDEDVELAGKLGFETYRLGNVKEDMKEVEPIVRDCDMLAFHVTAMRAADAPGHYKPTPNGFSADETCQIMRYAGLSDRLTSMAFYGYNPECDRDGITAQAVAQSLWYFIQGVSQRKKDYPVIDERNFNKYIVSSEGIGHDITFMKSKKSERWWIRIPDDHVKYKSHQLFPCSYKDYQLALKEEIPYRYWRAYNRLT